ncbi:zinc-dependent alcohol dehydrogenase family protein [Aspergillus ibericus CBS 121593]|uniref:Alcohol dehydrogenase n=1 Tax=Aspergillus ibericus CBS 121593 TaxID=1448316 RepID=A0A395GX99_9EURO|nr:alcohol dehydrogenase [Aspergillus ibericus CBS 121593]RAK99307.1 alcohol dehydrogenase [Aspergillus ibericus CBS 121593]
MGSIGSFNLPGSMRALEYTEARKFSIVEKPLPKIREHDVLIKVKACGVCGTDLHIHDGEFGAQFPLVPGHETVGVIAAYGSHVTGFSIGDRVVADNSEVCGHCHYCRRGKELFCENFVAHGVMVDGGFAEYAVYPAHRVFKFQNLSDVDATLLEPAACAAHGLDKIAPQMGSKVLLFGAGPTGLMLAQLLRQNGGCHTVIAAPGGLKMDLARSLDAADEYVELPREADAAGVRMEQLRGEHPYGFDIVVEATGSARVLEDAIHFVSKSGKLVVYGVYGDGDRVSLSPNMIFKEEFQVLGSFSQMHKFPAAIDYLADRKRIKVDGIVNKTFKLNEWEACLDAMRNKSVVKAAIVFD